MGVTGLWTVVQPCARPIKIETLNKKRLAVDASIWIYQFLKAVRDKEGNALRNSHVVGFFRRICKLLFIGIKPVFVFDGGAPALKRQTINARKNRREGRRDDAVRTAGKLLAVQMQRRAEEEEAKRKTAAEEDREQVAPESYVYAEEVFSTPKERQQNRTFRKKDQYHLPELGVSLSEMGGPNDPRIMSLEELEEYARTFESGEDINVYDFSKIDFDSSFFISLPATDRYNILNAARLRSRLRMGYSKDQLDAMFKDRMEFSKFQIERVRERNELTQRLMNINNGDTLYGLDAGGRVAGEKNREYVLVKNEGVEGGWALGVVDKDEGRYDKPIEVDRSSPPKEEEEEWEEDEDFEDVPIQGLNRLPSQKRKESPSGSTQRSPARQKFGRSRLRRRAGRPRTEDPDSLFVADAKSDEEDEEWEDVGINGAEEVDGEEDEELQRAIAMSLQQDKDGHELHQRTDADEEDDFQEVFQKKPEESKPFTSGTGLAIARMANNRSARVAQPFAESDSEEDGIDLQAALAESRKSKHKTTQRPESRPKPQSPKRSPSNQPATPSLRPAPLPFERLDLGSSLLGKKKMEKLQEAQAGGFERKAENAEAKKAAPLPPWFAENHDIRDDYAAAKAMEAEQRERDRKALEKDFVFQKPDKLMRDENEVIDLDANSPEKHEEEESEEADEDIEMEDLVLTAPDKIDESAGQSRAESPQPKEDAQNVFELLQDRDPSALPNSAGKAASPQEEFYEWSESEPEDERRAKLQNPVGNHEGSAAAAGKVQSSPPSSPEPEFEDVLTNEPVPESTQTVRPSPPITETEPVPHDTVRPSPPLIDLNDPNMVPAPEGLSDEDDDEHLYSDPEDEELFRQLAQESEEHARFASTFNSKTQEANAIDYERELKALRNQQKKDRRDADEVTQTMVAECQQLLSLFGLPYITAPMEAEAQCAELVSLGLVDGIVTDDSDIFLFGGTRVYKNMFNQAKFVECYFTSDLESEFGLTRERLIAIAQLLGSDYTEGLPRVGPVTALEVLSEFGDLTEFREWWASVQSGTRKSEDDRGNNFRRKFRKSNATKLFLPPTFPDPRVEDAYLKPEVDSDPSKFEWGVPDLDELRRFLMATIGWSQERTDEVLVPVIRDMNRRELEGTQSNITGFFGGSVGAGAFAPRKRVEMTSKRLGNALTKMGARARAGDGPDEEAENNGVVDAEEGKASGARRRRGRTSKKRVAVELDEEQEESEEFEEPRKKARKASSRGRARGRGRGKGKS
ncbi:DNA-repair protein rad13 [Phyllosticta citrichinensis]|uniref:DNA-repair protein rad13 n=1 Tax=Phyllosticta citrichinensis TaxID=1130410 RepID=A0ABR1Y055_9PEZI